MNTSKIIFAFILCLSLVFANSANSQNHFDKKIGELQDGTFIITSNQDDLLNELEDLVNANADVHVRFDKLSIEEGDGYYYLLAVDIDNNIRSARELVLERGNFYEYKPEDTGGSTTITCSGCNIGCNPYKLSGNWACYPNCTEGCTKTVTVVIKEGDDE